MEEYLAVINIVARRVTGSIPYRFQARGTSKATALQEVARVAPSHLHHDLMKLAQPPYYHFPMQARGVEVNTIARAQTGKDTQVRQLARLIHIKDQIYNCSMHELWETLLHLTVAQERLQPIRNMRLVDRDVLYGENEVSPYASAPPKYRLPEVGGQVLNLRPRRQARMFVGFSRVQSIGERTRRRCLATILGIKLGFILRLYTP